jgi:hypothetical protein
MIVFCALPNVAIAQQRPLTTEDPETIGSGRILLEGGLDYTRGERFPASGLKGQLLRVPLFGISIGISSIAEIQIDTSFHNRLLILERDSGAPFADAVTATGNSTSSVGDVVVATKVRVLSESARRPAFGLRFATKLPNASNESGLGLDTMDFAAALLIGKTGGSVRVVGNLGFGILGDATRGDRQNDVVLYGLSFARAMSFSTELVGEFNGRVSIRRGDAPVGTETMSTLRLGARHTIGSWRVDGAALFGVTSDQPGIGFTTGFTYVFNAFDVP